MRAIRAALGYAPKARGVEFGKQNGSQIGVTRNPRLDQLEAPTDPDARTSGDGTAKQSAIGRGPVPKIEPGAGGTAAASRNMALNARGAQSGLVNIGKGPGSRR